MSINKTNLNNNLLNRYTDKIKNCNFVIWFFKNSICLGNNYQLNTLDKLFWLWLAIIQNTRYLVSYWNNFFPSPTRNVSPFFYWLISYIFNLGFFFPTHQQKMYTISSIDLFHIQFDFFPPTTSNIYHFYWYMPGPHVFELFKCISKFS